MPTVAFATAWYATLPGAHLRRSMSPHVTNTSDDASDPFRVNVYFGMLGTVSADSCTCFRVRRLVAVRADMAILSN